MGERQEQAAICPSCSRRRGSPPGEALTHRAAAGSCVGLRGAGRGKPDTARLGFLHDLRPRPRLDVSIGACVCARVRARNEAELTGQISLNGFLETFIEKKDVTDS